MKDVLKQTYEIRRKAYDYGEEIAKLVGIKSHEFPADVFGMIFNSVTLGLELLSHYNVIWNTNHTNCSSIKEAKQQNGQRIILIQQMLFIGTMSSIEFCCKRCIEQFSEKIGSFSGRIYLHKIMKRSKSKGVISNLEFNSWQGVIELRNTIVHNNGISEKDQEYTYPNCNLSLKTGKMTQGDLKLFPNLTDWLLDAIKDWICKIYIK